MLKKLIGAIFPDGLFLHNKTIIEPSDSKSTKRSEESNRGDLSRRIDDMITKNFALSEFLVTSHKDLEMTLHTEFKAEYEANVEKLVKTILQPLRDRVGPITITSAFRSKQLNERIGGSDTSQHSNGSACDFITPNYNLEDVYNLLDEYTIGQRILYIRNKVITHIHVSIPEEGRQLQRDLVSEDGQFRFFTT